MIDEYIYKNHKKLRYGYTTGTCAAAAAKAAARMLLTGSRINTISIDTPKGILVTLPLQDTTLTKTRVTCAVQKDAGDDADCTDKILIYATVGFGTSDEIVIDGGIGIGRVTRSGLEQPIGNAAINSTPRAMIKREVLAELAAAGYEGGLEVLISAPEGVEIAKKTFNPRLGIEGGISILGTSGIVEPMSEQAIVDTIRLEMSQKKSFGYDILLLSPGNYGQNFTKETWDIDLDRGVKCSNFIGDTLDIALELGFERILFIGHIGKLIKIAAGVMNTHSRMADARLETLSACALLAGADAETAVAILGCTTTDDALAIIKAAGILDITMKIVLDKILYHMRHRTENKIAIEVVVFSSVPNIMQSDTMGINDRNHVSNHGILAMSDGAGDFIEQIKKSSASALHLQKASLFV